MYLLLKMLKSKIDSICFQYKINVILNIKTEYVTLIVDPTV